MKVEAQPEPSIIHHGARLLPAHSTTDSKMRPSAALLVYTSILPGLVFGWITSRSVRRRPSSLQATEEDWRQFRAKLVLQETEASEGWAYEAGTLIEKGSLLLSRVESSLGCHDLRQPYFHKAAVLVLEHDAVSTRGIVLNRNSNLVCSDGDMEVLLEDSDSIPSPNPDNQWPMNFGGDLAGLFSEEPQIVVLHSLSSTAAREVSEEILPNLFITNHHKARSLVAAGEASCDDFVSFYGYSLWEPGQLQIEVDRGSWYIVSMDSKSIWVMLKGQQHSNPEQGGLACWEDWTRRIGKAEEERVVESRNAFTDLLLKEWCREMLCVEEEDGGNENFVDLMMDDSVMAGPGSIVRATDNPQTFLLFDQLYHKSTVLLLKEEEELSLGLILNLPTTYAYIHELPNGTTVTIPIRYGGPFGNNDKYHNMEPEASPVIWLHSNRQLRGIQVGQPISPDSPIWTCSQVQALSAIDMGVAKPNDFLAIQGCIVWPKEMGAGGIAGELVAGSFHSVPMDQVGEIWSILGTQSQLSELEDVATTFATSQQAWRAGGSVEEDDEDVEEPRKVHETNQTVGQLSDEALRKWIEIFLLDNRKYVPFGGEG